MGKTNTAFSWEKTSTIQANKMCRRLYNIYNCMHFPSGLYQNNGNHLFMMVRCVTHVLSRSPHAKFSGYQQRGVSYGFLQLKWQTHLIPMPYACNSGRHQKTQLGPCSTLFIFLVSTFYSFKLVFPSHKLMILPYVCHFIVHPLTS